jgi:hypothetical protein
MTDPIAVRVDDGRADGRPMSLIIEVDEPMATRLVTGRCQGALVAAVQRALRAACARAGADTRDDAGSTGAGEKSPLPPIRDGCRVQNRLGAVLWRE